MRERECTEIERQRERESEREREREREKIMYRDREREMSNASSNGERVLPYRLLPRYFPPSFFNLLHPKRSVLSALLRSVSKLGCSYNLMEY